MVRYTVTLYTQKPDDVKPKLRALQVIANDATEAQEKAIAQCEQAGIVHGNIVSMTTKG